MTRLTRERDQQGFTLVEMLVAAVVLLLVLSVANALFYESVVSWRSGEARMDVREGLRLGLDRMSRELRTAQRVTDMQSDSIEFMVVKDDGTEISVQYYVNLSQELVRETDEEDLVLVTGVDDLEFTYLEGNRVILVKLRGTAGDQTVEFTTRVALRTQ